MKQSLITFPLTTNRKKRFITTYRDNQSGSAMRAKHKVDLENLERNFSIDYQFAYAYLPNQSIKLLVNSHLQNNWFYSFDIHRFFPSIDHQILLSKIGNEYSQLITECSNGQPTGLALGLVPSPYLSNIYLAEFDDKLNTKLQELNSSIVYTRYSDDMTISSNCELDIQQLISIISTLLQELNLQLNTKKTRSKCLTTKGDHIKVLGLNIVRGTTSNYITVSRKFKREMNLEQNQVRASAMSGYITYNENKNML